MQEKTEDALKGMEIGDALYDKVESPVRRGNQSKRFSACVKGIPSADWRGDRQTGTKARVSGAVLFPELWFQRMASIEQEVSRHEKGYASGMHSKWQRRMMRESLLDMEQIWSYLCEKRDVRLANVVPASIDGNH